MYVCIDGLSRAAVLAALYNASAPRGVGFLHERRAPLTTEQAAKVLSDADATGSRIDYLYGRPIKVYLPRGASEFDARLYDRDLGEGTAEAIVMALRNSGDVNNNVVRLLHAERRSAARDQLAKSLQTDTSMEVRNGVPVFHLGLAGHPEAARLRAVVERPQQPETD